MNKIQSAKFLTGKQPKKTWGENIYLLLILGAVFSLVACRPAYRPPVMPAGTSGNIHGTDTRELSHNRRDLLAVGTVYVAPVQTGVGISLDSATTQRLTTQVHRILQQELELEVIEPENSSKWNYESADLNMAIQKAKLAGADTILITRVEKFVERKGSRLGAGQAAQVGITIMLKRVSDSFELWTDSYGYSDQAFSDNILKLADRTQQQQQASTTGWLSADDLFGNGVRELASKFRTARLAAFQNS